MADSRALVKTNDKSELNYSIERWTQATVDQTLGRAIDITPDKSRAVTSFFKSAIKEVDQVTSRDVLDWHQHLLDKGLSERYIYASLSHLAGYFEWLKKTELGIFLKEDIRIEDEQILIHSRIKGGNYEWRTITDSEVRDSLERYLKLTRRKSLVGQKGKALWVRFDRAAEAARLDHKADNPLAAEPRLSSHGYDQQIKKYAKEAGIWHFHIHQFRHTFARIVAEDSGSIIEAQEALGHKDIQTTMIYISRIKFKKDKHSRSMRDRVKENYKEK